MRRRHTVIFSVSQRTTFYFQLSGPRRLTPSNKYFIYFSHLQIEATAVLSGTWYF